MMPSESAIEFAIIDFIVRYKWERMGILTSRMDYGMNGLKDFKNVAKSKKWKILATEHFAVSPLTRKVNATKELLRLRDKGTRVVILNCLAEFVPSVLEQASKLDMIHDWVWILTDGAISEDPKLRYIEGIVGIRFPKDGSGKLYDTVNIEWQAAGGKGVLQSRLGRIFDAVLTISDIVRRMVDKNLTMILPPQGVTMCRSLNTKVIPWVLGQTFINKSSEVRMKGVMASLYFSSTHRSPSSFNSISEIVNYQKDEGWVKVGSIKGIKGVVMEKRRPIVWLNNGLEAPKLASLALKYKKLKVLVFQSQPFIMVKPKSNTSDDTNLEFEGFCIDLLNELKKKLQFEYEIESRDSLGQKLPDGSWDGIIGDLTREKADLGVSTFTISPEREKAVDFTQPYFSLGYKIITKKSYRERGSNLWGFLDPFETTLWLAIVVSSIVVGTVVWIYDRLSPYGYYGRVAQSPKPKEDEYLARNTLCFFNSFWSAAASYLEQGPDGTHPISHSGRATTLAWWFAISIFGATYTANLAAFLTVNKYEHPIKSIDDLANQDRMSYGTAPGQLADMLRSASLPVYEKLWRYIESHNTLESNASYAIEKTRNTENYAFIWDSAVLDYTVQSEPCNTLTIIGRPFGSINYGFALPLKSHYTHNFSVAMLELQQDGFLERMTEKWFRSRSVCGAETEAADAAATEGGTQLGIHDLAGVFVTILGGVICGILILIIEWIVACYRDTLSKDRKAPTTFCRALCQRMQRAWYGILSLCMWRELGRDHEPKPQIRQLVESLPLSSMGEQRKLII
ncbi:glutamate receptor 1-like isoform X2 [Actinia tenebrosa]|nr:glutamate receptor 1-like isoform X2 [Actinia tenebrosa]